jgi:AcrR family transcriptional regulator
MPPTARRERFPRSAGTQARIIAAARLLFARHGYAGTTIRAVATAADVHPSMIMRYLDSKEGLFAAAAEFDLRLPDFSAVKPTELGVALVRHFLDRWEGEGVGDELRALLSVAQTSAPARDRLIEVFNRQVGPMIARLTGPANHEQCAALIATQMLGLAFTRYILCLPGVVALPAAVIEVRVGATIQAYLDLAAPAREPSAG